MGFTLVAELMVESLKSKPVIGHNLMYDILYFYNQFMGPLPATYSLFLQEWHKCFQAIFDTKIFAARNSFFFPSTVLSHIIEKIKEEELFTDNCTVKFDTKHCMTKYMPTQPGDKKAESPKGSASKGNPRLGDSGDKKNVEKPQPDKKASD